MSQILEIFGKGLVGTLWSIFGKQLSEYHTDIRCIKIRLREVPDDYELLMQAAVSFYRSGDLESAMLYSAQLRKTHPESNEVATISACILEKLGQREQAIEILQDYANNADEPSGAIFFAIGIMHETLKNEPLAEINYNRALQYSPNLCNAHQRLAAIKYRRNQPEQAAEHYETLCKIDPEDIASRIILAGIYLNNGEPQKASAQYQIALTIEPDNWTSENELVKSCIKAGKFEQAIEVLKGSLEQQGEFPDTYLQLGELYAKLGNDHEAQSNYLKAFEMHPGYLEGMVKFGTYHIQTGRYLQAAEWFSKAIEINDRLLKAYVGLSIAQYYLGLNNKSDETVELAAAIEPNTSMLFAEISRLELKASAVNEAKGYLHPEGNHRSISQHLVEIQCDRFAQAIEENPGRADWHYRYGLLLKSQGKTRGAAEQYKRAIDINPDYVKALIKLGLALNELGEPEQARKYLDRAVKLEPEYNDVHYQLGLIYADQARYHLAVEEFEQSLRQNGQNVDALSALAQALENIGMHQKAQESWQAIIELAPQSEQAKLAQSVLV